MVPFHERLDGHLAWCLTHAILSFDRCREILGISTMTMREVVNDWAERGLYKDQHAETKCIVCGGEWKT